MTTKKDTLLMSIEKARELIDTGNVDKALVTLTSLHLNLSENLDALLEEDKQHYALFFQLLAEAKLLSAEEYGSQEIISDLDKSLSFVSIPRTLQLKAEIVFSKKNSEYIHLYQQAIEAEDFAENHLKLIIAFEKNNQHAEALKHFKRLLKTHFALEEIAEIKRFLKETGRDLSFKDSGRFAAYQNAFYSKYSAQKKRSRSKKRKSPKQSKRVLSEFYWSLLSSFMVGLYVSVFYITNNLTMLPATSIVIMFLILTIPAVTLTLVMFGILKVVRKGEKIAVFSMALSIIYLLLILRPAIIEMGIVTSLLGPFGGVDKFFANFVYAVIPAILLAHIFKKNTKKFSVVLGIMMGVLMVMSINKQEANFKQDANNKWGNWQKYENIKLAKRPNIYFILSDGYSSFSFMRDKKIDISSFQQFLTDQHFRLYDETFTSYQFTLQSMPAFLNMEHHYYTTVQNDNLTEVNKSGRVIIAGDNNFFRVLKANGYSTENIHQGTYLLLRGNNADYNYPQIDKFTGAKVVLSRIFDHNLLTDKENINTKYTTVEVHKEVMEHLSTDKSKPVVQYIHIYKPSHSPNEIAGKCEEEKAIKAYAAGIKSANPTLKWLIKEIIRNDPEAVIVLAGDHGPYISNKCDRFGILTTPEKIRDRVGILTAIRWPTGYDGRYDNKIKTSVNMLRYLLASLAENEAEVIKTAVPDDVYVMMKKDNEFFFKIVEEGEILTEPKVFNIPEQLPVVH